MSQHLPSDSLPDASQPALTLPRSLTLVQGTALNMIDMVGIGPFVVLPLVIKTLGGGLFLWAWVLGAVISLIDAFIWAELGAAFPQAGGSYNFLKISYGEQRWGRLLSFLYVWQTLIQAPLVMASGAIGFAQYASYLMPLEVWQQKAVSGVVVLIIIALLYRKIDSVGKIGLVMWGAVLLTLGWIIVGGLSNARIPLTETIGAMGSVSGGILAAGLGSASVKTLYCYLGYYNVCHLGGEIKQPTRNIPASMFISIVGIAILYLLMNLSVVSVVPWQVAQESRFIVSTFVETLYGADAARFATVLVLLVAFSSLFAVLLGYSRVPYAAAADGQFFKIFARLHPTRPVSVCIPAFSGWTGVCIQPVFPARRCYYGYPGHADCGAVCWAGRWAVAASPPTLPRRFPVSNAALSCSGSTGHWRMAVYLFFHRSRLYDIGPGGYWAGYSCLLFSSRYRRQWPFEK